MIPGNRRVLLVVLVTFATLLPLAAFLLRSRGSALSTTGARSLSPPTCQKVEERHWRVPKTLRDGYLSAGGRLNEDIRLQPVAGSESGSLSSLTIAKVSTESPMYVAGFRTGDRVLKVNEKPVTTMMRALNLASEIQACGKLTVQVERKGEILDYLVDFE